MTNALVGHTGFVGGHLARQFAFDACFNSRNSAEMLDRDFELLVCAAAPGSMFEANRFPNRDFEKVSNLIDHLSTTRARNFVLISSIAVFASPSAGDDEDSVAFETDLAYGRNRRRLEEFCAKHFDHSLIVRLPALFGTGLRKNFLFDLLNPVPTMMTPDLLDKARRTVGPALWNLLDSLYSFDADTGLCTVDRAALTRAADRVELEQALSANGCTATMFHSAETTYQYYGLHQLRDDIHIALEAGLSVIHLASEPLRADRIHERLVGRKMPPTEARRRTEDMRTRHAKLWGRTGPYIRDASETLEDIANFFSSEGQG